MSSKQNSDVPIFELKNVSKRFGHFQALTTFWRSTATGSDLPQLA